MCGYRFRVFYTEQTGYRIVVVFTYSKSGTSFLANRSGQLETPSE